MILLQPLTPHSITGPNESMENNDISVLIKKEIVQDHIYHSLLSSPVFAEFFISAFLSNSKENIVLSCGEPDSVIPTLFRKMLEESMLNCDVSEAILIALLIQVLLELSRSKEMHKPQREPGRLRSDEIIRYICEHSRTATLQSAANYFNYHPNYIAQTLREECGQSFVSIKHDFLLKNARILIEKTSYPIRDVAQLAGFESINFFFRIFKRTFGVTPKEYRELHQ
jgi:AraC-like DNA-binding protein